MTNSELEHLSEFKNTPFKNGNLNDTLKDAYKIDYYSDLDNNTERWMNA